MKIIFIGQDLKLADAVRLSIWLRWLGAEIRVAQGRVEGVEMVKDSAPNIVILDLDSFDYFGQTIRELRRFSSVPIIVLSSERTKEEMLEALTSGADRGILLPCGVIEMATRIWALWRRVKMETPAAQSVVREDTLLSGTLLINPSTYEAFLEGKRLALTSTEFRMLYLLMKNRGTVVSRQTLERALWGDQVDESSGLAKKYIHGLRRKLGDDAVKPFWIVNIHGIGYRFIGPPPQESAPGR